MMADQSRRGQAAWAPTIVVPLDGSEHALVALPIARVLAELEKASLHVVHVGKRVLPPQQLLRTLGLSPEQFRGSVIDQAIGSPAQGIVQLAREWQSALIVMCTYTALPQPGVGLGRVAEEVLATAPCPVVLVSPERGLQPWALRQIVVPHDGTPTTDAAIHPAVDLAEQADAELLVLHVAAPGASLPTEPGTVTAPRYLDQPQHEWPSWVHEFVGRFRGLGHVPGAVPLHLFLATGEPADAIVRFVRDHQSDLIALAWRGHLEEKRAATLKAVITAAPCPVMVTRVEA
ncbi:MAG TPA: universal stress protein [Chloroflexota bacterium]|nr:universal stress protein [Chloroflexota bacterium]